MRKWSRYIVGVVAIAGWLALAVSAGAETCKLETKRLDGTNRTHDGRTSRSTIGFNRRVRSRSSCRLADRKGWSEDLEQEGTPEFSKVISKEPSTYNSQHPFRGVAKLGSQYFGFVFDTRQS